MANKAGVVYVEVRGDTSHAQRDIQRLGGMAGSIFGAAGGAAKTVLSDLARGTAQTVAGFTALGAVGAKSLVDIGLSYNTLEQSSLAAFETLLGTKEAAEDMQASIREFGKTSPFPRQAFIEGTQQLLAFGYSARKVIPTLDAIQDSVAATGGSSTAIADIVDVLAKITSTGKITAVSLNQLGLRGIDAAALIGQGMNKTADEIRSSITNGTLDAGEAVDTLVEQMSVRFGGAAEGLKNTWVGATDRIKGAWRDMGSDLMDPLVARAGGGIFVDAANDFADALRNIQSEVIPVLVPSIELLGGLVGDAAAKAKDFTENLTPSGAANRLAGVMDTVRGVREDMGAAQGVAVGLGVAIAGLGARSVLGPLGFLVPAISPITGVLGGLVLGSKDGRAELQRLGKEAREFAGGPGRDLLRGVGDLADNIQGPLIRAIGGFGDGILAAGERAVPILVRGLELIGPPIGTFLDASGQLARTVLPEIVSVLGMANPLLEVAGFALSLAADGAQLLADNAWLVVPALAAIAGYKFAGSIVTGFQLAADSARHMLSTLDSMAKSRGVSMLTATGNVARTSVGNLTRSIVGGLNPAMLGIAGLLAGGTYLWQRWTDQKRKAKEVTDEIVESLQLEADAFADSERERARTDLKESGDRALGLAEQLELSMNDIIRLSQHGEQAVLDLGAAFARTAFTGSDTWANDFREEIAHLPLDLRVVGEELIQLAEKGELTGAAVIQLTDGIAKFASGSENSIQEARDHFTSMARDMLDAGDITEGQFKRIAQSLADAETPEQMQVAVRNLLGLLGGEGLAGETRLAADELERAREQLEKFGAGAEETDLQITQDELDELTSSLEKASSATGELISKMLELTGRNADVAAAERGAYDARDRLTEVIEGRREAIDEAASKISDLEQRLAGLRDEQAEAVEKGLSTKSIDSQIARETENLRKAQEELAAAQSDVTVEADRQNETWRKTEEGITRMVEQWETWAEALTKTGDYEGARTVMEGLQTELENLRAQGIIPTEEALETILNDLGLFPETVDTKVRMWTDEAEAELEEITSALEGLPGGEISGPIVSEVQVAFDNASYWDAMTKLQALAFAYQLDLDAAEAAALAAGLVDPPSELHGWEQRYRGGRASGGPVWPGAWLVGEHGPEILELGGNGHVYNAAETRAMMSQAQATPKGITSADMDRFVAALERARGATINQTIESSGSAYRDARDGAADAFFLLGGA